uniref:Beta-glucuronosyltransferase GlcAT14B n=1 Tax=Ananas comosus var. bracteatus TaxID=296719 RepID=A0A6V7PID3_ANACO|nr:unnamed protein product [Ananas comosus var. bracteatus]
MVRELLEVVLALLSSGLAAADLRWSTRPRRPRAATSGEAAKLGASSATTAALLCRSRSFSSTNAVAPPTLAAAAAEAVGGSGHPWGRRRRRPQGWRRLRPRGRDREEGGHGRRGDLRRWQRRDEGAEGEGALGEEGGGGGVGVAEERGGGEEVNAPPPFLSSFSSSAAAASALFVEPKLRPLPLSPLPASPRLAYLISGFSGDGGALLRALLALYHPRNRYVVHLDLDSPAAERDALRDRLAFHPVLAARRNVKMIFKANLVTYRGPTMVANTLHAAAVLLRDTLDWDWFINLSIILG